ncbi:Phage pentapeptide repeat family protein (ACLAME 560) [uncultured Rubrobacteraceae bacterium]|uniref:Phage pentapeptide repeat family protein (ACLAME 560) n=1 Tax=uncultured Rubrobacteraceae bacterium TaxID=349277 RepID=A0A6J4QUM9_9ACTN|nr:Phage pentapeptide repeat family protein (ACLAME 560) [uncultured Rubrobacteraceae bacterium]
MGRISERFRARITLGLFLVAGVGIGVVVVLVGGYYGEWGWTGFARREAEPEGTMAMKTLWDWQELLLVPLALALAGWWLNRVQTERETRAQRHVKERDDRMQAERARTEVLEAYLDDMTQILLHEGTATAHAGTVVKAVAEARTAAALLGLDATRKRRVAKFLYELGLIKSQGGLDGVGRLDLWCADFDGADLEEAQLPGAFLQHIFLRGADLRCADLRCADLRCARMDRTALVDADLSGADLRGARGLTQEQIQEAEGTRKTLLPDGLRHPASWGAEAAAPGTGSANAPQTSALLRSEDL